MGLRSGANRAFWLAGLFIAFWSCKAFAISGNDQVSLAGTGQFEQLVTALEQQAASEPMKAADWHALCYSYFRIKRYDKIFSCLDQLDKALLARDKRTRLFGLDDATPTSLLMRGETFVEIAQYSTAIDQAQRAIDWYVKDGESEKDILVQALAVQAISYKNLGKLDLAQQAAQKLEATPVNAYTDLAIGAKSLALARVNMSLGYWQKALDALAFDRTLGLRAFVDNVTSGAFLKGLNNWVWLELPRGYMQTKAQFELGDVERARSGFDNLLKVPQLATNGEIYWMVLSDRALIASQDGDDAKAIALYRKALEVIERQRASINTEANKIGFIGDKQDVYARLVALLFKNSKLSDAFEIIERAKSRALVDLLASKSSFAPPRVAREEKLDIVEILGQQGRYDAALGQQSEAVLRSFATGNVPRENTLKLALPAELQSLVSVSALTEVEIQSLLSPDEALLSYFANGSSMYAMVITKDSTFGTAINAEGLENDVRRLRASLAKRLPVDALLKQLQARLLAPVESQIKQKRLSIVAHGALHYLPFAALFDGQNYLAEKYSLRMLPSASVLKYLRPARTNDFKSVLIMGNPDLKNPAMDLPGAQVEAQALANYMVGSRLLMRADASRKAFIEFAPQTQLVHVASHGEFDASNALSSGLLLAPDGTTPGRLTVSDVYQLALDAEMVTLSACETGLGRIASGDDVVSFTRGFLYAGTSTVMASLWQVDDDSTTFMMTRFYQHLRTMGRGEALRSAQADTRAKFPHPYFWASFYLTGAY
jgi:CHAT domain-containing protein